MDRRIEHCAAATILHCVEGKMEITVSDSEKRSLGAGNAVHRARVIGAKDCVAASPTPLMDPALSTM
jgi:hypothetical protein